MSLIFKSIKFKNFISFGNQITEIELDTNENILMYGENGAGKTTIMEAIYYALQGKPYRNIKQAELINTTNTKELYTELILQKNEDVYLIKRGMKPNIFEIELNGKEINMDSKIKDYQRIIDDLIGVDSKTFSDTIFISSKNYTPFMALKASDKRNFIENIFDIKKFSNISDQLKIQRSLTTTQISNAKKDIENQENLLNQAIEINKKINDDGKEEIKECEIKLSEINKKLKELNAENKKIETWLEKTDIKNDCKTKKDELQQFSDCIRTSSMFVADFESKLEAHEKEYKFLKKNDICPTCHNAIDGNSEFFKKYISELVTSAKNLKIELNNEKANLEKLTNSFKELNDEIDKLEKQMKLADDRIYDIERDVKSLKMNKYDLEKTIKSLSEKTDNKLIETESIKNKIKEFNKEQNKFDVKYDRLIKLINMMGDKGIKRFVVEKYLPILNSLVNKWLQIFNANYRVKLDNTFKLTIIARGYETLSYHSFSSGENQRIDLSLLFAFYELSKQKNSMDMSLLLLDEISDKSLDKDGLDGLLLAFEHFKEKGMTIFNITHRPEMKDKFDKSIRVYKDKFSKIDII